MSTALQCPSCGCNHRLESIPDAPVFDCARCGRPLKVPAQYRAGAAAPAAAASAKGAAPRRAAPKSARAPRARGTTKLPLRILAWIVAFVLGAVVVRTLAKWTGFVGGDTVVNLLIDNKLTTYLRLAALVPAWALFATIFATLILEGPGWWALRKSGASAAPTTSPARSPAKPARTPAATAAAAGAARTPRKVPTRAPKTEPPAPATRTRPARPAAAAGRRAGGASAADPGADEFDARAAAGQRPRRIPRRDTGS